MVEVVEPIDSITQGQPHVPKPRIPRLHVLPKPPTPRVPGPYVSRLRTNKPQSYSSPPRTPTTIGPIDSSTVDSSAGALEPVSLVERASVVERLFPCDKCEESFVSQNTLDSHVKFDHRPRPTCGKCFKKFDCKRRYTKYSTW